MIELARIGLAEFAAQLELDGGADRWYRLVLPAVVDQIKVAEQLALEIEAVLGASCERVDAKAGPVELARLLHAAGEHSVVIFGVNGYTEAQWEHVDLLRSQLVGGGTKVLLTALAVIAKMESHAPNLSSFLGGATWQVDLDADYLSEEAQEQRLAALRHSLGYTDAEVIALAQQRKLPLEPDFAEWLVLLGRGELL